jgi:hypothetical protein
MEDNQARQKLPLQPSQRADPRPVVEVHILESGNQATKSYQVRQVGDRLELYLRTPGRGSTCGTFVNKERLQSPSANDSDDVKMNSRTLVDGDVISLGPSLINSFVFVDLRS